MYSIVRLSGAWIGSVLTGFYPAIAASQSVPEPMTISRPEAGIEATAYVGGRVWISETQNVTSGARVTSAVRQRKFIDVYEVPAFAPLVQQKSKAVFKACVENGACLLDDDGDGRFDRIAESFIGRAYNLDVPAAYERIGVINPQSKVTREIRLVDVNSQTIRLSYVETSAAFPNTSSTEVVTLDRHLSALPAMIVARQVRITILSADNDGIRYRVESAR